MMIERTLQTAKGTLHYWQSENWKPDADTLFFMHGLTADHTLFDRQAAFFEPSANVLAWDAPGHGKSRPFEAFDFDEVAGYVKTILDELDVKQAVFVGQSLGGYFAQSVLKLYPQYVKGFVSIGSTPYGYGYYSRFDIWCINQVEWMALLCPFQWMKRAMAKQVSTTQAGYDNMMQMLAPYGKRELCHLMGVGYAGFLKNNCDLSISCPVLLLLGEYDKTGKVRQYNKEWTKRTGFPLVVIKDAAHNANVDKAEEVNALIQDFLTTLN